MNPYVGACGGRSFPMQVGQGLPGQFAGQSNNSYWQNVIGGLGGFGSGLPAGTPGAGCGPGGRLATPEELAAGYVDAGGRCYLAPPYINPGQPSIPYNPPPPYYGGPCGPAVFPQGFVAQQALSGIAAQNAPQQPIGLQCDDPLLPERVSPTGTIPGDSCDACCTAQGCFCVTDIVVGDCGPCVFLISSIKSGLCELIQCGDILGDTFYCNCSHPPLKSSMLMPGIEFCISVTNILSVGTTAVAPTAGEIAAATRRFFATVWGLPGDNSCAPCIGPDPYQPPYLPPGAQIPRPVYPPGAQIPRPTYPPGYYMPPGLFAPQQQALF